MDPFALDVLADPVPTDTAVREAAPLVWLPAHRVWAAGRHADVAAIFRDWSTWSSAAGTGLADIRRGEGWRPPSVLLDADPPAHTAARRVMNKVLAPRALAGLAGRFAAVAERVVDDAVAASRSDGAVDAATVLAERFPMTVLPDAVGMAPEGREHLLPYAALNFESMGPHNQLRAEAERRAGGAREYVAWQMRREALTEGGIGAAVYAYADAGDISADDAALLVRSFLSAGIDTTILALASAIHELARRPAQWDALHADPGLARAAFEEGLRLHTPSPVIGRTATREVTLGDDVVRPDEKLLLMLGAANRDPRRCEAPDDYDLHRGATGHTAFGGGVHNCVGQVIARMEAEALLGALASRVARIAPAGESRPRLSNWLRGFATVPVRLVAA
ncbi:hypothetical protein C8D89_12432 [Actinomycetospora cinnamomea]|uniref:Cytochrome P450 n=1 Tax=Actinomycetospora cinnamomea TaxID=663609 RepID=A0A2U1EC87_9PSEU|nr:hypothetical protein C8D89_12432 [Actinomycetospora cinnamomea]